MLIWGLLGVLSAINIFVLEYQRRDFFETERALALQEAALKTGAFAEETSQLFEQIDQALRGIRSTYRRTGSISETESYIQEIKLSGSRIENGYLVDQAGRLVVTHNPQTVGRSVADRAYFQFHKDTSQDLPFLAQVEYGRATQQHFFRVTRRIDDAQGGFLGVALVTVKPAAISELFGRLLKEEGSIASLVSIRDRKVRARMPVPPEEAWDRVLDSPIWEKLRGTTSGTYSSPGAIDGVLRHFAYRVLPDWQVVVITGISDSAIRARANDRFEEHALLAFVANMVLLVFAGALSHIDHQRQRLKVFNLQQARMLDNDLVGISKVKNRVQVWENRALERMFGYAPGELRGSPTRLLYPDDESYEALGKAAYPVLSSGRTFRTELKLQRKDGTPLWVDISGAMISEDSDESIWMMLDISALKLKQSQVEEIAFHDNLTGLPNRLLLADRLQQAIPAAERLQQLLAVAFIDLDGFKAVNDKFGHAAGDKLLKTVSDRLLTCVRGNDTVARMGGDEFVLLLTHLQAPDDCLQVLNRALEFISMPVEISPSEFGHVSASIGVAMCPNNATDPETLMAMADKAMYLAKSSGKNSIKFSRDTSSVHRASSQPLR